MGRRVGSKALFGQLFEGRLVIAKRDLDREMVEGRALRVAPGPTLACPARRPFAIEQSDDLRVAGDPGSRPHYVCRQGGPLGTVSYLSPEDDSGISPACRGGAVPLSTRPSNTSPSTSVTIARLLISAAGAVWCSCPRA